MLASVLHKFEQNRNLPGSPKLTFFSELKNKEIKHVICFHSFYLLFRHKHIPAGPSCGPLWERLHASAGQFEVTTASRKSKGEF